MSGHIKLQYYPLVLAANATTPILASSVGGLFCTGGGTFTINSVTEQGTVTQVVSFTGVANTWYFLPFYLGANGGNVVTGAGATGTLAA